MRVEIITLILLLKLELKLNLNISCLLSYSISIGIEDIDRTHDPHYFNRKIIENFVPEGKKVKRASIGAFALAIQFPNFF